MRKVIRGYARDKDSNLFLLARSLSLRARINALPGARQDKRFLVRHGARSSRKKLFVSALGRPNDFNSLPDNLAERFRFISLRYSHDRQRLFAEH